MTQEWILKTLIELGFRPQEAEIYLLLVEEGPKKAIDIAETLKIYKRKVYRILKKLQETKIIEAKATLPTQFQAIPFDNFLDFLIKASLDEVDLLEKNKPELFMKWKSITEKIDFNDIRGIKK